MKQTNQNLVGKNVIVRSNLSGVHVGTFVSGVIVNEGEFVTLANARRLWKWKGSNDCSELATFGISSNNLDECNISVPVEQVSCVSCETVKCSDKAYESIMKAKFWASTDLSHEEQQEIVNNFIDANELINAI